MDDLEALERAMWDPTTRNDAGWMDRHLSPDFVEFGRSGRRYDRDGALVPSAAGFTAELSDIDVADLGDGVVLLTYRSAFRAGDDDPEFANRSSIWVRVDDGWRLRFHQGTPCGG